MKAYVLRGYGGPDQAALLDTPAPSPGPRDLQVQVSAAGLNPVDFKIRAGALRTILRPALPFVLGNELAGVVRAVGAQVRRFRVGDRVVARVEKSRLGAFAEIACVDESVAAHAPTTIALEDAAGLPLAGLTALQALRDELGAAPGKHLLITAGAGGVGTFAIQIAKLLGARVTTTASARGEALVRSLGADEVIDYTSTDLAHLPTRFDGVFDLAGGATLKAAFGLAKPGTMVLSVAGMPEPTTASKDLGAGLGLRLLFGAASFGLRRAAAGRGVRYRYLFMHPSSDDLDQLVSWVDAGALRVVVDRHFEFSRIAEAMAYLEGGRAKGKVVVVFP
jgi:NADPH:quinone reductase-like Zn-dependent oxidoreductase